MPRPLRRRPRRRPHLRIDAPGRGPEAVVVLVHGGPERGFWTTSRFDAGYLRMLPFGAAIRRAGGGRVAVVALRHRQSGWNGPQETVLAEARWALADIERRFPGLPVGLVGHSRGGRSVLRLAGESSVGAVVALAPWVPRGEPVPGPGCEVLVVQGEADVVCPARDTDAYVEAARAAGVVVRYVRLPCAGHVLALGAARTHANVARYVTDRLLAHGDPRV